MITNKNGLDEMQKGKRNAIGNQMFMLMFYVLLLDIGLYGAGIRWMKYPADIMIIIVAFMAIYLFRTISANAYLPPKAQNRKTISSLFITIGFTIFLTIAGFNFLGSLANETVETANDNSALILFIISAVSLIVSLSVLIMKKINDKNETDD